MTIEEWRKKYKRCKWCSNAQLCGPHCTLGINGNGTYYKCTVKDKVVNINKPRPLCRMFQLGEPSIEKPIPPPARKLEEAQHE